MFRTLDSPKSASIIDVCAQIFRNMTLHHSETEKGKNPWLDVTSSVSNIRRISRSFLKKGVDEKLISPVEKNMTWQISSSEMFPHETERLSFRTVKEVKILVNDSSINIIFREISLEPLRSLNPLPSFDVCSRIFRNMTLHHSETEKGKTLC